MHGGKKLLNLAGGQNDCKFLLCLTTKHVFENFWITIVRPLALFAGLVK